MGKHSETRYVHIFSKGTRETGDGDGLILN